MTCEGISNTKIDPEQDPYGYLMGTLGNTERLTIEIPNEDEEGRLVGSRLTVEKFEEEGRVLVSVSQEVRQGERWSPHSSWVI